MAEQLAVDQRLGNRAAVERHEPLPAPHAAVMERTRHQLLAGAALALDQDRDVLPGEPIEGRAQLSHRGRGADQEPVRRMIDAVRLESRRGELAAHRGVARRGLDHRAELVRPEWLGQVVEGAGAHAGGSGLRAVVTGQHDDRGCRAGLPELPEHIDAAHPRQTDVEDHDVPSVVARGESLEHRAWVLEDLVIVTIGAQLAREELADLDVILHHHHPDPNSYILAHGSGNRLAWPAKERQRTRVTPPGGATQPCRSAPRPP